jgi:2-deoxy-D-gluconate 3-dehydrogenase
MFDLSGKLALVTGCRRGIGLLMVEVLARAGADIIGVSAQLEASGSEAQRRVEAAGRSFSGFRVDLANRTEVLQLTAEVAAADSPVDILINNAGIVVRTPAVEHDDRTWDAVLEVNLTAPFVLTREIGRGMVDRGAGKVIFTASLLSFQGGILIPSYTASKSGVAGLI